MLHQVTATQTNATSSYSNSDQCYIKLQPLRPRLHQVTKQLRPVKHHVKYYNWDFLQLRPMLHQVTATRTNVTSSYSNSDPCYIRLQQLRPVLHQVTVTQTSETSCYHNWDLLQLRQLYSVQLLRQANNENNGNI